ncbi:secreted protein [Rhodopirellula maiorica SM1]|uniref:Secreted protein n=1 Tax=Rhodopirellula maiorica SM1 TaxID=1265738 RepID=M5R8D9_9BACT|nr:secreted protein [Rhodopirellula maiorica SM1]
MTSVLVLRSFKTQVFALSTAAGSPWSHLQNASLPRGGLRSSSSKLSANIQQTLSQWCEFIWMFFHAHT